MRDKIIQRRSRLRFETPELSGREAAFLLEILDCLRAELLGLYGDDILESLRDLDFQGPDHAESDR